MRKQNDSFELEVVDQGQRSGLTDHTLLSTVRSYQLALSRGKHSTLVL